MRRVKPGYAKSAGCSPAPSDMLSNGPPGWLITADIIAVDRGEGRTLISPFRGFYGSYPRKWTRGYIDLGPDGITFRRGWPIQPRVWHIPSGEPILSASIRPFEKGWEAANLGGGGVYAQGQWMEWLGTAVVRCETPLGVLEFAIRRADLRLFMHYLELLRKRYMNPQDKNALGRR